MKILLDECIPRKLQYSLPDVSTPLMQLIAPLGASLVVLRRTGTKGGRSARVQWRFVAESNPASPEHRQQVILRYFLLADDSPCLERLVRNSQGIRHIDARPVPSKIIVRRVSIFLQLSKCSDYFLELCFNRS